MNEVEEGSSELRECVLVQQGSCNLLIVSIGQSPSSDILFTTVLFMLIYYILHTLFYITGKLLYFLRRLA